MGHIKLCTDYKFHQMLIIIESQSHRIVRLDLAAALLLNFIQSIIFFSWFENRNPSHPELLAMQWMAIVEKYISI